MKEFLNPDKGYKLIRCEVGETPIQDNWIEVPDGSIFAVMFDSKELCFYRKIEGISELFLWNNSGKKWTDTNYIRMDLILLNEGAELVWQRDKVEVEDSVRMSKVDETLKERQSQYGDFTSVANTTGQLMSVILNSRNGKTLPYAHEEALHMICSKIARVMNGDINHKDSWHDIGGYAKLIEDLIGE